MPQEELQQVSPAIQVTGPQDSQTAAMQPDPIGAQMLQLELQQYSCFCRNGRESKQTIQVRKIDKNIHQELFYGTYSARSSATNYGNIFHSQIGINLWYGVVVIGKLVFQ